MTTLFQRIAQRGDHLLAGALYTLAAQDLLLLAALWAGIEPHPAARVAPFIAATLVLSLRAAWGLRQPSRWTYAIALVVALVHLPSFGPHKFFLEQAPIIWPMVIVGLAMIVQAALAAGARLWQGSEGAHA